MRHAHASIKRRNRAANLLTNLRLFLPLYFSLSLSGLPASQKQMTAMGTPTNETHKNTLKVFTFDLEKIIHFRANKKPKQQQKQQQKQPALACG